ncbi:hypothetical protein ABK040_009329 [Willaertia magna]
MANSGNNSTIFSYQQQVLVTYVDPINGDSRVINTCLDVTNPCKSIDQVTGSIIKTKNLVKINLMNDIIASEGCEFKLMNNFNEQTTIHITSYGSKIVKIFCNDSPLFEDVFRKKAKENDYTTVILENLMLNAITFTNDEVKLINCQMIENSLSSLLFLDFNKTEIVNCYFENFIIHFSDKKANGVIYIDYSSFNNSGITVLASVFTSFILQHSNFFDAHFEEYDTCKGVITLIGHYEAAFHHNYFFNNRRRVIYCELDLSGLVDLYNNTFTNNFNTALPKFKSDSLPYGGAFYFLYKSSFDYEATIRENYFENNIAYLGGAIFCGCDCHFYNNTFIKNKATSSGGAIYLEKGKIENCVFKENKAEYGGALFSILPFEVNNITSIRDTSELSGSVLFSLTVDFIRSLDYVDKSKWNIEDDKSMKELKHDVFGTFPERIEIFDKEHGVPFINNTVSTLPGNTKKLTISFWAKDGYHFKLSEACTSITLVPSPFDSVFSFQEGNSSFNGGDFNVDITYKLTSPNYFKSSIKFKFVFLKVSYKTFDEYQKEFEIPFEMLDCPSPQNYKYDSKSNSLICEINLLVILLPLSALGVLISVAVVSAFIIFCRKFKKIKQLYKKKTLEEEKLEQRLLDLEALFDRSENESEYSYKKWIIKAEEIKPIKKIGEGGGGVVYQAVWNNRIEVALKCVKIEDEEMQKDAFEFEASIANILNNEIISSFMTTDEKITFKQFSEGDSLRFMKQAFEEQLRLPLPKFPHLFEQDNVNLEWIKTYLLRTNSKLPLHIGWKIFKELSEIINSCWKHDDCQRPSFSFVAQHLLTLVGGSADN